MVKKAIILEYLLCPCRRESGTQINLDDWITVGLNWTWNIKQAAWPNRLAYSLITRFFGSFDYGHVSVAYDAEATDMFVEWGGDSAGTDLFHDQPTCGVATYRNTDFLLGMVEGLNFVCNGSKWKYRQLQSKW